MNFPYLGVLSLAHPWYLLWVVPGFFLLMLAHGGSVRLGGEIANARSLFVTRLRAYLPLACLFATVTALGLGFAGLRGGFVQTITEESSSRLIVTQDQSGSMYNVSDGRPLHCLFRGEAETAEHYSGHDLTESEPPRTGERKKDLELEGLWAKNSSIVSLPQNARIEGACVALETLLYGLEERTERSKGSVRHEVAFLRFADTSVLQEPFTTDYAHLRKLISEHNWRDAGAEVGSSTNLHLALYDMFLVALRRHIDAEPGVTPIPEAVVEELLGSALADPKDTGEIEQLVKRFPELFRKLGDELADTSLVVITDATGGITWSNTPSAEKLFHLARIFHMPVYVISTEVDDVLFRQAVEATGTPEHPGGFFVTNKLGDYQSMKDDMQLILDRALARKQAYVREHRESYSDWCFGAAFFFLSLAFFLKEGPLGRSLTG